jgi:hypothetical protein
MAFTTFTAFNGPDAADLNRFPVQIASAIKAADTTRTNTTTRTDDPHLVLDVEASTIYWLTGLLIYAADGARDLEISFRVPAGSTIDWVSDAFGSSIAAATLVSEVSRTRQTSVTAPALGGNGSGAVGNNLFAVPRGIVTIGGTAGTVALQWAQASSGAVGSIMRADSVLLLRRLAV